jgi:hypothetical protein
VVAHYSGNYTLQDYRDLIRNTLDLGAADIPDSLVDEWVRDAATKCQTARQQWPFYESKWTFNTVASTASYAYGVIQSADNHIGEIVRVKGPNWDLEYQPMRVRDAMNPTVGSETSGPPQYWSVWPDSTLVLDPVPTGVESIAVYGFTEPEDWVSDGAAAVSDIPDLFDTVILNWATGRAYAQQDEPQTSVFYLDLAQLRLEELKIYFDDPRPLDNVILNGGWRRGGWVRDPRISWE